MLNVLLQESALKRLAFARKQRAIRDAVRIGDQIIRRNRRMLLASTFNAWKVRTGVYRQVARRFQASLEVTLRWAWTQWRAQLATQVVVYQSTSCKAFKTLLHFTSSDEVKASLPHMMLIKWHDEELSCCVTACIQQHQRSAFSHAPLCITDWQQHTC